MKLNDRKEDIQQAANLLAAGGLVAFPTETVYGLGADASNVTAVGKIFAVKGRPVNHPLIVHLGSADLLDQWAEDIPDIARQVAKHFWPGPLTLILKRSSKVLDCVTGGQDTVGLRVPGHPLALSLLQTFGGGLAAPSANYFGKLSPTTAAHVKMELGDLVDAIMDGGPCEVGVESTILDLSGRQPQILRPGAITPNQLAPFLGMTPAAPTASAPRASGTLDHHYAPRAKVYLLGAEDLQQALQSQGLKDQHISVMSHLPEAINIPNIHWHNMPSKPAAYAHQLYASLHKLDRPDCDFILVADLPVEVKWQAVRDRLQRAASPLPDFILNSDSMA